jgi:hypothetical protein
VLAFASSPSSESIGVSAACASMAIVAWLRTSRRAKRSPAQVSQGALPQQGRPPGLPLVDGLGSGAYVNKPHSALLMPVEALKRDR